MYINLLFCREPNKAIYLFRSVIFPGNATMTSESQGNSVTVSAERQTAQKDGILEILEV